MKVFTAAYLLLLFEIIAMAECVSLIKGQVFLDVQECGHFVPEKTFILSERRFKFINELSPVQRQNFYRSYKGMIVKGLVARSSASRSGLDSKKGVLAGETVDFFFPPGRGNCQEIYNKRLQAELAESCCQGGGEPPCLLSSTYVITNFDVLGSPGSGVGNKRRTDARKLKSYRKAEKMYAKKSFGKAAKFFRKANAEGNLDMKGLYKLAHSYRATDNCKRAIPILKEIFKRSLERDYWTDDEQITRQGVFMLARCYAKTNSPGPAVNVLNGYLHNPKRYRKEINRALNHRDLGGIRSTLGYREFSKEARQLLGR